MLILDPMGELAEIVSQIEDVLRFCESETDQEEAVLDAGALAAGHLALELREAAGAAPRIVAPDGSTELGPILRCPTAAVELPAVRRAVELVVGDELLDRAPAALATLRLVERCLPGGDNGPGEAAAVLLEGWPHEPGARWVLTADQHDAYARLCDAVLDDALDRFAMGG